MQQAKKGDGKTVDALLCIIKLSKTIKIEINTSKTIKIEINTSKTTKHTRI